MPEGVNVLYVSFGSHTVTRIAFLTLSCLILATVAHIAIMAVTNKVTSVLDAFAILAADTRSAVAA